MNGLSINLLLRSDIVVDVQLYQAGRTEDLFIIPELLEKLAAEDHLCAPSLFRTILKEAI